MKIQRTSMMMILTAALTTSCAAPKQFELRAFPGAKQTATPEQAGRVCKIEAIQAAERDEESNKELTKQGGFLPTYIVIESAKKAGQRALEACFARYGYDFREKK